MAANPTSPPSSTLPLQDRVAMVTGATSGIGKVVALHLASLGAKLVINYHSKSIQAQEIVSEINSFWFTASLSPRAIAVHADISNLEQIKALFDAAEVAFQRQAHILIACARTEDLTLSSIANSTVEHFDRILKVNTMGKFFCIREAANRLKKGGGGRIITFSGTFLNGYLPGFAIYNATMKATEAMTKVIAKELKGTKITANCVMPGAIEIESFNEHKSEETVKVYTNASPLLRLGKPKDVAALIGVLVSGLTVKLLHWMVVLAYNHEMIAACSSPF
ncbi:hypothetical protein Ancab_030830 [Ancistrocladus abbreviatus]